MTAKERETAYIRKWRLAASSGWAMAMLNVAGAYRRLGNTRLAFTWFKKAAECHDGSGLLEIGYCYHVGAGVRRNTLMAEEAYRKAIRSRYITQYEREEAMYLLAVLLLQKKVAEVNRSVKTLLRRANQDNDYLQAWNLYHGLASFSSKTVCLCRRDLMLNLAKLRCPVHSHHSG